jgi:aspartyl-tRNA(Asn)/glutamyl-tRNA(Gln) amidotransferase subunit A
MIGHDAATIADDVNAGRTSAVDVVDAFIGRIEATNPTLNALVRFDASSVRRTARAVDVRIASGERLPLAGVPVVVKDNIWVGGHRIAQGSKLFAEHVAPADAIGVERLRRAGAVIIGIGNCSEFAAKGVTTNPLFGPTRHPMNPTLTPGGSSGGNAAALAAGFAPIALGTDAGGSSRRPPAHTGIVGFKPSLGAIPYGPGFPEPFWGVSVLAPMGRTVSDVASLFEAIAGPDPRDPESISVDAPYGRELSTLRIAWSPRLGLDVPVDDDVAAAIEAGISRLAGAGWRITRADPIWPADAAEAGLMPLQHAGLAAIHGAAWKSDPSRLDPDLAAQIERGLQLTGVEVAAALETSLLVRRSLAGFMGEYDLLLCPTTPTVAWPLTQLGPKRIGGVEVPPRGHAVFTPLINHALAPAISIPCGRARDGLPVGLQLIGQRGADRLVLAAARAAETLLGDMNDYPRS